MKHPVMNFLPWVDGPLEFRGDNESADLRGMGQVNRGCPT